MTPEDLERLGDLLQRDVAEVLQIDLTFELDDAAFPSITIRFSIPLLFEVYRAMHRGGVQESRTLALFGYLVLQHLEVAGVDDDLETFSSIWADVGYMFGLAADQKINRWEKDDDLVLSFCYFLLQDRLISRANAAAIAPFLMTDDEPAAGWDSLENSISTDAWRLKVDRWAKRNGLDPVGIRKRERK